MRLVSEQVPEILVIANQFMTLTRPCPKQESTLKSWLGNSEGARVFDKRAQFFFSRGHLAPDADFIYKGPFTYDVC